MQQKEKWFLYVSSEVENKINEDRLGWIKIIKNDIKKVQERYILQW